MSILTPLFGQLVYVTLKNLKALFDQTILVIQKIYQGRGTKLKTDTPRYYSVQYRRLITVHWKKYLRPQNWGQEGKFFM